MRIWGTWGRRVFAYGILWISGVESGVAIASKIASIIPVTWYSPFCVNLTIKWVLNLMTQFWGIIYGRVMGAFMFYCFTPCSSSNPFLHLPKCLLWQSCTTNRHPPLFHKLSYHVIWSHEAFWLLGNMQSFSKPSSKEYISQVCRSPEYSSPRVPPLSLMPLMLFWVSLRLLVYQLTP